MQIPDHGFDGAEEANLDGRGSEFRGEVRMDRRVLAVPEVFPVLAHEDALLGEARRTELPSKFQVMLEVNGILEMTVMRRSALVITRWTAKSIRFTSRSIRVDWFNRECERVTKSSTSVLAERSAKAGERDPCRDGSLVRPMHNAIDLRQETDGVVANFSDVLVPLGGH